MRLIRKWKTDGEKEVIDEKEAKRVLVGYYGDLEQVMNDLKDGKVLSTNFSTIQKEA